MPKSMISIKKALMVSSAPKLLFSTVSAAVMLVSLMSVLPQDIFAGPTETYLRAPRIYDFVIAALTFIVCYALLSALQSLYGRIGSGEAKPLSVKQGFVIFIILCLCWLPYWLNYFPGGLYSDTIICFRMAMGERALTNHHPILYTGIIKLCLMIAKGDPQGATFWLTFGQYLFCAGTLAYVVRWLSQKGIGRLGTRLVVIFFALFPFFPLYAVYNWKDTPFAMSLVLFTLTVFDIALSKGDAMTSPRCTLAYCLWGLLVCFLRNNGMYIVLLTTIILMIVYRKSVFNHMKGFTLTAVLMSFLVLVVQGPLFSAMGLKTDSAVESFGIPIQQVGAVIVKDKLSKDEEAYFKRILPIDQWQAYYAPLVVDHLKWDAPDFRYGPIEAEPGTFVLRWAKLLPGHFPAMVEAYLLATNSYWHLFRTMGICNIETGIWFDNIGVKNINLLKNVTTIDLTRAVESIPPLPEGICLFFLFTGVMLLILTGKASTALGYIPILLAVLTVFLATPIASSLRYVFYLVPMIPVYCLAPLFTEKTAIRF